MDRNETKKIVMVVKSAYPNWNPANMSETIDTWCSLLSDYTYNEIAVALKSYILADHSGFAPAIGQIIDKVHIADNYQMNEMQAWALVSKALRNGYYGAEEEFDRLPPIVQKAVGQPSNLRNWSQSDNRSIETVIQSNFMRAYNIEVKRSQEVNRLPMEVKAMLAEKQNVKGIGVKEC